MLKIVDIGDDTSAHKLRILMTKNGEIGDGFLQGLSAIFLSLLSTI